MADQKITELTALTTAEQTDLLAIVDDPAGSPITKKITVADVLTALGTSSMVRSEVPSGTINGTNTTFTLANTPLSGSERIYLNGQRLKGSGEDYSISGLTITMITAPVSGDILLADYEINTGTFLTGSTSFIYGEQVNESPTGSLAVFTVDNAYVASSTQVYVDGQLQFRGGSNDYTESTPASGEITFTYNPASGSTILVTYQHSVSTAGNADTVDGLHASDLTSTGWVLNEVPTGLVNGSNTTFTLSQSYVSTGLQVYRDGQLMKLTDDYTETTPASGIFDFVTAPTTGSVILVAYKHSTAVGGLNADTLDGYEATELLNADGWVNASETWVYASASTFTIAGVDVTDKYAKGTRIKFNQSGVKYGVVVGSTFSTNTTVIIAINDDYTIANATITDPFYSYQLIPQGYPSWFNYTPAFVNFTLGNGVIRVARYIVNGTLVTIDFRVEMGSTSSMGTAMTISHPILTRTTGHNSGITVLGKGFCRDTGTNIYTVTINYNVANKIVMSVENATGTYTDFTAQTTATIPFTWTTNDEFGGMYSYEMAL